MTEDGRAINGNLGTRAVMDTGSMEWTASPSGTVWRKRVHLVGAPESGQVTSIVRYQPGYSDTTFLERWAPGTETVTRHYEHGVEFFVLDGEFEDEEGAYPAGAWLRIPPGVQQTPRTSKGCKLYVKEGGIPYLRST